MTIAPIKGHFESVKAMLHHIAADESVEKFAIVTFHKDGTAQVSHLGCERRDMAMASLAMGDRAIRDE